MKKLFIPRIIATAASLLLVSQLFAQQPDSKQLPDVTVTSSDLKMDERVWNNFQKEFKEATNVTWYKKDKTYIIKFILNEIAQTVLYSQKGQQVYHLSYVEEKNMPAAIKDQVKSVFYNYAITLSIKVEQGGRTIWVVNMENDKKLLFVRLENGEMELVEELDNAGNKLR